MTVDPIPTFALSVVTAVVTPAVDPAPTVTKVDPTPVTYAFVIAAPTLIELPTDTPEVLFTKIWVDPTPTVDVI